MKISKPEHIAQGNGITYMNSDLSLVQLKVLMTIIRELQKPISMMITDIGFGRIKPDDVLPAKEQFMDGDHLMITRKITIKVKDVGLGNQNTGYLLNSLNALRQKSCCIPYNPARPTKSKVLVTGLISHYTYDCPAQTVDVYLLDAVVNRLLLVSEGFTRYDYTHAMAFSNKYTVRMYWIINSWRGRKGFRISMEQLRYVMSAEDKYPRNDNFISKVIGAAYKELKQTGDIWFEYSRDLRNGKDMFSFRVYQRMDSERREKVLKKPKQIAYSMLYNMWKMQLADIDHFVSLITVDNVQGFICELDYLNRTIDRKSLKDPAAYMKTVLISYFDTLDPVSQEVTLTGKK